MSVSVPLIQVDAIEIATKIRKNNFNASNGWLENLKHCCNVVFNSVRGETNDVEIQTVTECKAKIEDFLWDMNL